MFGLCLYLYAIAYLVVPIILVVFIILGVIKKKLTLKTLDFFVTPIVLLTIPLLLFVMVNYLNLDDFGFFRIYYYKTLSF